VDQIAAAHPATAASIYSIIVSSRPILNEPGWQGLVGDYCSGYHGIIASGFAYAVNIQCPSVAIDDLPEIISHELAEAATDREPLGRKTWQSADPPSEVADRFGGLTAS